MIDSEAELIETSALRIGLFVYIDLGWLAHPFPLNAFKIRSQDQIDTIRSLGLTQIRYSREKSDPEITTIPPTTTTVAAIDAVEAMEVVEAVDSAKQMREAVLSQQRASLKICEREYSDAAKGYRQISEVIHSQPEIARQQCEGLVGSVIEKLLGAEESSIRLLSEQAGERTSLHSVNVTVIALLLGKAMGLGAGELSDVGIGALLHDVGKLELPSRLRWRDEHFSPSERLIHEAHVGHSVAAAKKAAISAGALLAIAQHHECADGSGYPLRLRNDKITLAARIVALVNYYDNLCNPNNPVSGITPHEALALMFSQKKSCYDGTVMAAFIRMMGVYPPGSVVQLNDGRFALVVSVNSNRPLKPYVVIHQPEIPRDEALAVDLEASPELGIRRSLKPMQLPKASVDYLSPRERICYFFERARSPQNEGGIAA